MVSLQIISKILLSQDDSIIENNLLTEEYFVGYEQEFNYIKDHVKQYGNVPDKESFLSQFPEFELVEVTESDKYLVDTIREEYLYYKSVPVIQKAAELLKTNANTAAEYMINELKNLQPNYSLGGLNIIADANLRYEEFIERRNKQDEWFFTCGFEELDELWHGLQRGEEFVVIMARTNQGKSWVLEKMTTHIWQIGFNVGYISPEMGASSIGYRFDTLNKNFSNKSLAWGKDDIKEEDYYNYIQELQEKKNKFLVATPLDFDRSITISKLRNWVKQNDLHMIAVDGITYLSDERYKRGDNKTTSLTNISEDLMALSMELKIPIIVVVQVNRSGVIQDDNDDTPELDSVRDSDGIAYNASKVLSIRQKDNTLIMQIKKQRMGSVGGKLIYNWDINTGEFQFMPSYDDGESKEKTERKVREVKKKYKDKKEVF